MTSKYDAIVTVGDDSPAVVGSMMERIVAIMSSAGHQYSAYLTGKGRWDGHEEASGALLYTDIDQHTADYLRELAVRTGFKYNQQAVGVMVVPAGSALLFTGLSGKAGDEGGKR